MVAETLRYLLAGIVNTIVGYGVFLLAANGLGLDVFVANALGSMAGLSVAYLQSRYFVFRGGRHVRGALPRFLVGFALAYLVNVAVLDLLHVRLGVRAEWAQLGAMASYTVSFYLLSRWFVWRAAR